MPEFFRLKKYEQSALRAKSAKFNTMLVKNGLEPRKDSEILHEIIHKAIEMAEITETGKVELKY